jgi:hypothetical protein
MARFTKALRQQIIREFSEAHGGVFDPAAFLTAVHEAGEDHPAYEWFEWSDDKAALEYRLDQARDFARGLVVRFEVQEVHRGKMRIAERSAPLVMSPLGTRRDGGGYVVTDPSNPDHMEELRRQAAGSLRWYISRYEAVLADVGAMQQFERTLGMLDAAEHREAA